MIRTTPRTPHHRPSEPAGNNPHGWDLHPILFLLVVSTALFFAFVVWSTPVMYSSITEWHESWQRLLMSRVCHQQIDRTFTFGGIPLAVCSRCTGVYTALPVVLLVFSFFFTVLVRAKRYIVRIFAIASLLVVLDGAGNLLQLWQTPIFFRLLTGTLWGTAAGLLLIISVTIPRDS